MNKLKLMIIVGTRPEIIRLSEVIKEADKHFDLILVHTGQNYDKQLSEIFFENFHLKQPDYFLKAPGNNLGETVGNIISKSYSIMDELKPDALLVLGDTNSCLASYSAKRLKIPIFHMEAGNRCFDFRVPEEINRRLIDHMSDVNLAYTENARRYLINEGLNKDFVYVTGSPMTEVLTKNNVQIEKSNILANLNLKEKKYFVVSMHREENINNSQRFHSLLDSLNTIAELYSLPLIFSTHPRTLKQINTENIKMHKLIKNLKPLDFFDYNKLQSKAFCVLSDSGTVPEEASILNFPAVSLRDSTERPEALDAGVVLLGGIESQGIINSIDSAVYFYNSSRINPVSDYQDINIAEKVMKIIQSYTPIVNQRVWKK